MIDQSTSPFQQPQPDTTILSDKVCVDNAPSVATMPTLTMSRGTRPLRSHRPANGNPHGNRRNA